MSHRRHQLVRGRPDRKNILQQVAREQDQEREESLKIQKAHQEPKFSSVKEAFDASRRKPCRQKK